MERRSNFDTRPTQDQTTVASQADLSSFVAFLSGNPYKTLWEMHIPLIYDDYPLEDLTSLDKKILNYLSHTFLQNLAEVDTNPDVMREVFTETSHGMKVFEFLETAGQGENPSWLAARGLKLTASTVYKVLHFKSMKGKRSFLRNHLWGMNRKDEREPPKKDAAALTHGKTYEKKGIQKYLEYRQTFDSTVSVDDTMGLTMRQDYPEFGCSPDGLVYSNYNAPRLLEIKCPFSLRFAAPEDYEDALTDLQKRTFYLEKNVNGDIVLKQEHAYYYQIQFSLGILGLEDADLVIYTFKGILVITIKFDQDWWTENAEKLKSIHHRLLVPEYFLQRTPRNLLPFEFDIDGDILETSRESQSSMEEDSSGDVSDLNDTHSLIYDEDDQDELQHQLQDDPEEIAVLSDDSDHSNVFFKDEDEVLSDNNSVAFSVSYDDEGNAYF